MQAMLETISWPVSLVSIYWRYFKTPNTTFFKNAKYDELYSIEELEDIWLTPSITTEYLAKFVDSNGDEFLVDQSKTHAKIHTTIPANWLLSTISAVIKEE